MRKAGILLAVSSLPGRHGIGDFGKEAYQFVDMLEKSHVKIWQVLPLNPLGYGNSPYQPYSSNAMDELYISLDLLEEEGFIEHVKDFHKNRVKVDYETVRKFKGELLRKAYSNFKPDTMYESFKDFSWVYPYAVFLTLKKHNGMRPWNEWNEEEKNWIYDQTLDLSEYEEDINYEIFVQYILYKQWHALKKYANSKGIALVGDSPIYVGIDSEDVYSHRENFLLDDDGRPEFIAGVPPDYFSETGQRWGNPIYDWEFMEKDHFSFWVDRLAYTSTLFDSTRIDHFRAFDTYWKIPASCPTAIEGEWVEAPGYALFDTLFEEIPELNLIAEDLGELREEVYTLRDHYHFKGMRIVQFTFDPYREEEEDRENLIIYTGTHDNQTIRGWFNELEKDVQTTVRKRLKELGCNDRKIAHGFVKYTLASKAEYAILPMQDILNLDDSARMNEPGTIGSPNWEWKMNSFSAFEKELDKLKEMIVETNR